MPPRGGRASKSSAPTKGAAKAAPKKKDVAAAPADEDDMYEEPFKRIVRPENQLELTETEMKEEMTRVLTANDPNLPSNPTKYHYKDQCFKIDPPGPSDALAIHFTMDGCALHVESSEAKDQENYNMRKKDEEAEALKVAKQQAEEAGEAFEEETAGSSRNQFNYSERAAQTPATPMRDRGVATTPPSIISFAQAVSQWEIYDAYIGDMVLQGQKDQMMKQQAVGGADKKKTTGIASLDEGGAAGGGRAEKDDDMLHSKKLSGALKILERMVNQNAEDEIFQDFKYWDDASDQFRESEGSMLPLWRFKTSQTKRKQVTALAWNPQYTDLFAVGYGSYDFMRQGTGLICGFSMKNTPHPEFEFFTDTGAMCLDFHPNHPSLLAVGCYDGNVMVYDVAKKGGGGGAGGTKHGGNGPIYASSAVTGKHSDPVWQVRWSPVEFAQDLSFNSISGDGRVTTWVMSKSELKMEPLMQLRLPADGTMESPSGLAGGLCFDFHATKDHLYLIGTEEGRIHMASTAYSGQYLETFSGHHLAVYTLRWNRFHPDVFISCSADWTVMVWDSKKKAPLMTFDLGSAVGDVSWAPYSSTVFAAVTSEGKVHIFDLNENKHEPLCEQKIVKRAKLTTVSFSERDPVIFVGDERGSVNSLKLSPNLRKVEVPTDDDGNPIPHDERKVQVDKMDHLLGSLA